MQEVETFLHELVSWATPLDEVFGIVLVGSYARQEARPDSDVDLVLLSDPRYLLEDLDWCNMFGKVLTCRHVDYGMVQSKHILYDDGLNVEYGITSLEWTKTQPVDHGTRRVVLDGMRILYDPHGVLKKLEMACKQKA